MDRQRALRAAATTFGLALGLGIVLAEPLEARVGPEPSGVMETSDVSPMSCPDRGNCGSPLKAGIRITFTGWSCTTGFLARTDDPEKRYLVTAGHCMAGSGLFAQWSHHGNPIGRAALDAFEDGSSADAGAIEIEQLPFANVVYGSAGSDLSPIVGELPDRAQTIGAEVCRSGGTSGWTCGHIVAVDVDTKIAGKRIRHTWWTDFPSAAGDSGGPILDREGRLLGIVIATTPTQSVYSTVDSIAQALHLRPCLDDACA